MEFESRVGDTTMTRIEGFIDHFERDFAIVTRLDRTIANISRRELPESAREGDFIVEANSPCHYLIDQVRTEKRRQELRYLYGSYFD